MSYHAGKNIVTDGLVFQVDAANKLGGNSTDTKNLVDPTEVGTFNGSLVVNSEFNFDGVDDYIDFTFSSKVLYNFSYWFYTPRLIDSSAAGASNLQPFLWDTTGTPRPGEENVSGILFGSLTLQGVNETMTIFNQNEPYRLTYIRDNIDIGYHNVSINWNGANYDVYIDGVQKTSYPGTSYPGGTGGHSPLLTTTFLNIGGNGDLGTTWWTGKIATTKIYNRALTPSEISQNYEATKHKFE